MAPSPAPSPPLAPDPDPPAGLTALINDHAPKAIKQAEMKTLFGRKVAIDASMSIYQFLIAVRQQDGQQLMNDAGETTSHLMGLFYRTIRMVENDLKPCYVFDGKPPQLKSNVVRPPPRPPPTRPPEPGP